METMIDQGIIKRILLEHGIKDASACIKSAGKSYEKHRIEQLAEGKSSYYIEGYRQGYTEGYATGWAEEAIRITRKMKSLGVEPDLIAKVTGVAIEVIMKD